VPLIEAKAEVIEPVVVEAQAEPQGVGAR